MNFHEKHSEEIANEIGMEEALRHFRESVHAWGDKESSRSQTLKAVASFRSRQSRLRQWLFGAPVLGWGLACVLVVSAISIPFEMHYLRVHEADNSRKTLALTAAVAATPASPANSGMTAKNEAELETSAIDDEALLSHVDSDVAQATPDAMAPLAKLMQQSDGK